jgi:hypothetical protein
MAGVDLPNQFPNSYMAQAVKNGQSRFRSIDVPSVPVGGQSNVNISGVTTLTIPAGANYAVIQATGGAAYITIDGTTPSAGSYNETLAAGSAVSYYGAAMAAVKIIGTTMSVTYFK